MYQGNTPPLVEVRPLQLTSRHAVCRFTRSQNVSDLSTWPRGLGAHRNQRKGENEDKVVGVQEGEAFILWYLMFVIIHIHSCTVSKLSWPHYKGWLMGNSSKSDVNYTCWHSSDRRFFPWFPIWTPLCLEGPVSGEGAGPLNSRNKSQYWSWLWIMTMVVVTFMVMVLAMVMIVILVLMILIIMID